MNKKKERKFTFRLNENHRSHLKNLKGKIYVKYFPGHDAVILLFDFDSYKFDNLRLWHEWIYLFILVFFVAIKKNEFYGNHFPDSTRDKKKYYFCPKTLEAYKILKEINLILFLFLFCPTGFHATGEYIVICAECYMLLKKYFDIENYFYDCRRFLIHSYIEHNKIN